MTQAAIFQEEYAHTFHLEFQQPAEVSMDAIRPSIRTLLDLRADFPGLVLGFGSELWSRLSPDSIPQGLRSFDELTGPLGFQAPSTQSDLFVWLHSRIHDDLFECALKVQQILASQFELTDDTAGFHYRDSRDLNGFIDGSANPKGEDRPLAALIPKGQTGAGGSFVMTQKWIHDLPKFKALDQLTQERIIGRTKPDSIELEGDAMPDNSHVSRTDVKVDGVGQKVLRQSTPWGTVSQHGLYYLAFACELSRFDVQLERMYGLTPDALHDRLIEYSQAVSGAYWFAPGELELSSLF